MKIRILIISIIALTLACSKDTYLRLNSSDIILELLPEYEKSRKFRSNTNDTIEISKMSYNRYFVKTSGQYSNGGSLSDFDYIESERIDQTLGSNNPYLRFDITIETIYNPSLEKQTEDYLHIKFSEKEGEVSSEMKFVYIDSLQCISHRCVFIDSTFKLQNRSFDNLYMTRRDSINRTAIYWDEKNGLIGFKTSDNKIYELLP